jgi:hypothetical protein
MMDSPLKLVKLLSSSSGPNAKREIGARRKIVTVHRPSEFYRKENSIRNAGRQEKMG